MFALVFIDIVLVFLLVPLRAATNRTFITIENKKEADMVIIKLSKINTSLQVEYFAEAFQEYLLNKDKLKEACPKTYAFLNKIIKRCDDMDR